MRIDDAYDDNLVAREIALRAETCAQTRAADAEKAPLDDPIILTNSSHDPTECGVKGERGGRGERG